MEIKGIVPSDHNIENFWKKVQRAGADECWNWSACTNPKGYGVFGFHRDGKDIAFLANRFSYAMHFEDPGASCVLHRCDNPKCVNPAHLFLGTRKDNNLDMTAKGRHGSKANPERWMKNRPRAEGHACAKLDWTKVRAIRAQFAAGATQTTIASTFGISMAQVGNIVHNRQWVE